MKSSLRSIFAGFMIGVGGWSYLASPIPYAGAFMFSVGLLVICQTGQNLYTGKICYARKKSEYYMLPSILILNLLSAYGFGWFTHYVKPVFISKAQDMCSAKLNEGLYVVPLAICCNILIYFAVECFRKNTFIGLILCVMAFIICGFEHCIANAYYLGVAGMAGWHVVKYLVLNVIGNTVGGLIVKL